MKKYKFIVFDLDDTLLDTWTQLAGRAAAESCTAMIAAGLNADTESCLKERNRFHSALPRANIYEHLVRHFGVKANGSEEAVIRAGMRAFYERNVEKNISLFGGARELLETLKKQYKLFLVTSGSQPTQKQKIDFLGIAPFFAQIYHVDPSKGESKHEAFKKIMAGEKQSPERFLSVGNRIDTDVAEAKALGWDTCWVRYGEYAHLEPSSTLETPTYQLQSIKDLSLVCQL